MASRRGKLGGSLILVILLGGALLAARRKDPPLEVDTFRVERGEVRELVVGAAAGDVKPARRVTVRSEIAGSVAVVAKRRGDRVSAGDLVVSFTSDELDARVLQAEANVEAAEAAVRAAESRVAMAKKAVERGDRLRARESISEAEVDHLHLEHEGAVHALEQAVAARKQAVAARKLVQVAKARAFVRAPFSGVLQDVAVELAVQVAPGQALFDLIDDASLHVDVPVDESDLAKVFLGQRVSLRTDAARGQILGGTVTFIPPAVGRASDARLEGAALAPRDRSLVIEVTPDDGHGLVVGASANAELLVRSKTEVPFVPSNAVIGRGRDRAVLKVEDGRVRRVAFRPGLTSWERTEILSGLEVGDEVVATLGAKGLEEGVRVASRGPRPEGDPRAPDVAGGRAEATRARPAAIDAHGSAPDVAGGRAEATRAGPAIDAHGAAPDIAGGRAEASPP